MKTSRFSVMSGKTLREALATVGVIISLVFVGMQIRESNIQARAAAYQAIGIATAQFHMSFDARMNRLATESSYPAAVKRWKLSDWDTMERIHTADLRMLETILLQVEQGLLPEDAMARLGYNWGEVLREPDMACLWPELQTQVGSSVRDFIEKSTPRKDRLPCQVNLQALRDATVLGHSE